MNEKFFNLSEEKRVCIINAGYRIFAENSYKKSPVSEIAAEAGISKSLLFHYFRNKKELYLYLLEYAAEITFTYLNDYRCYEKEDIFEIMLRGLTAKINMMKKYPDITRFTLRAYYETDAEVADEIKALIGRTASYGANSSKLKLDPTQFKDGLDLEMMYNDMYFASEGYLWENTRSGIIDVDKAERDFRKMINFWKSLYLKQE